MDRNADWGKGRCSPDGSLSARRAWIEMLESKQIDPSVMQSLSARRAWIEIRKRVKDEKEQTVALRKESVDRNVRIWV